jgi:hypothetical protein
MIRVDEHDDGDPNARRNESCGVRRGRIVEPVTEEAF